MREELWDPARGSLDYSCKDSSSSWWILKDQLELICIVLKDYFRAVCLNFFFLGKHWSGCRQKGQNPHLFSCLVLVCLGCFFCIYTGEQWVLTLNHTGTWSQIRPGENCVPPREINLWSAALPLDKQSWQTALFIIFHDALKWWCRS